VPEAFYEPDGKEFLATELSRGPWDPAMQHAGPVAALIGRAIEQLPDSASFELGRLTFEILGPVPIGPVEVQARIVRPGRRVQLVEAELGAAGEVLIRARAWQLRVGELDLPAEAIVAPPVPGGPEGGSVPEFFPTEQEHGYQTGMEFRAVSGGFIEPGPATMWLRMRLPLVAGEEPSALQRLLIVADVGNGISASLDYSRFVFINVDLTVQIERLPEGDWIGIDAVTLPQRNGRGTAESVLFDRAGRVGRALQTLLIFER
jgi:acyl-Coa thioesterase superfamily protein/acyl-CoA thioesterase superfamily protein